MTPSEFNTWRKRLGLRQVDVADLLGLDRRTVQIYDTGRRPDRARIVEVPQVVALACARLDELQTASDDPTGKGRRAERRISPARRSR